MQTQPAYNPNVGWPNNENHRQRRKLPVSDLIISVLRRDQKLCCERTLIATLKISAVAAAVAVGLWSVET
jgi:hypothetical protein